MSSNSARGKISRILRGRKNTNDIDTHTSQWLVSTSNAARAKQNKMGKRSCDTNTNKQPVGATSGFFRNRFSPRVHFPTFPSPPYFSSDSQSTHTLCQCRKTTLAHTLPNGSSLCHQVLEHKCGIFFFSRLNFFRVTFFSLVFSQLSELRTFHTPTTTHCNTHCNNK